MSKTKKEESKIKIEFIGQSSHEVTGSSTLITINSKDGEKNQYLLECGLRQSNKKIEDLKINSEKFPFKVKELKACFIFHNHIDHSGRIGLLVKRGYNNPIYIPKGCREIIRELLLDSQRIIEKDCMELSKKKGCYIEPLYSLEDVEKSVSLMVELDFNTVYEIDDYLSVELIHNSHIINASSGILWCKNSNSRITKILYTSDIGNLMFEDETPYVNKLEKISKCNYIISECTYGSKDRQIKYTDRKKDIEKLQSAIDSTCFDRKSRLMLPVFSLGRCQLMMTTLWELYHDDENFNIPIYIDGKLSNKINKIYSKVLEGEQLELWNKVYTWKNFKYIVETIDSKNAVEERKPCIILASGAFMVNGRSIPWAKDMIPKSTDMILFCGYGGGEGSIPYRIKNGKENKTITIDKKKCMNRCQVGTLVSYSSHIQYNDLLQLLGKEIICDGKIYLIHGDMDTKINFAKDLKLELEKNNRTTGVVCVNKGSSANVI